MKIEKIPSKFNIPRLSKWYINIFATMLLDIQKRFYFKIEDPIYLFNKQKTVCYWYLKMIKAKEDLTFVLINILNIIFEESHDDKIPIPQNRPF